MVLEIKQKADDLINAKNELLKMLNQSIKSNFDIKKMIKRK